MKRASMTMCHVWGRDHGACSVGQFFCQDVLGGEPWQAGDWIRAR